MRNIIVLLVFVFFLVGCYSNFVEISADSGIISVRVEIADDDDERMEGLMFREKIGDGEGMLFIFEDSQPRAFWMKNTLIPLDIIFISEDFTILNIEEAEPCVEDLCGSYLSEGNAKYVLEVGKGFSEKNNIKSGDVVKIK